MGYDIFKYHYIYTRVYPAWTQLKLLFCADISFKNYGKAPLFEFFEMPEIFAPKTPSLIAQIFFGHNRRSCGSTQLKQQCNKPAVQRNRSACSLLHQQKYLA